MEFEETVSVVAEVDQVKEAIGGNLMPQRVTLLHLADMLSRVDMDRVVDIRVGLRKTGKPVS